MTVVPLSTPSLNRRQWCAVAAALCAPSMPGTATEALIAMLPALRHFPDYLFTPESAQELASRRYATPDANHGERRNTGPVPAWDEITRALNAYRRQYVHEPRPALPAPAEPERAPPTQAELDGVAQSVARALGEIAAGAQHRETLFPEQRLPTTLRDVSASGEALGRLRRERFARLVAERKLRPEAVPPELRSA